MHAHVYLNKQGMCMYIHVYCTERSSQLQKKERKNMIGVDRCTSHVFLACLMFEVAKKRVKKNRSEGGIEPLWR